MKRNIILVLLASLSISYAQAQETRKLNPFTSILILGGFNTQLINSDSEKVEITVKGIDAEKVITDISGKTLKIRVKKGLSFGKEVSIKIYYKSLDKIECKAGATVKSTDMLKADKLSLKVNSSARIELKVNTQSIHAKAGQGGVINLQGTTDSQEINAGTAGIYDAFEMVSNSVVANANTGALVKVYVKQTISASASSGATISYMGNPKKESRKTNFGGKIIDIEE